jgi:molybdate transport system substrate-binding protein
MKKDVPTATPSISLMSTLAIQGALVDVLIPQFERSTGINVQLTLDPTNVLVQKIHAGERADLIVAVSSDIQALVSAEVLSDQGAQTLVSTHVGLGVHPDSPGFPLNSVDDLKVALINAKSVVYSRTGASGVYFARMLERLGIAEQVNARATLIEKGLTGEHVIAGRGDIAVQQLSELAIVKGLKIVGPLPEEVGNVTHFSIGRFKSSQKPIEVRRFSDFLVSEPARAAYLKYGLNVII